MEEKCIQCGLPFKVQEKGYLFIAGKPEQITRLRELSSNQNNVEEGLVCIEYDTKEMLLDLIKEIERK